MDSRDEAPKPLQPVVELTPEACREVIRAFDKGLEAFRRWGVPLPGGSWLHEARAELERVVENGTLGPSDEDLRRVSAAVNAAVDLYHISTSLGDESIRSIVVELAHITRGRLLSDSETSQAKSYASQFWVGTWLAQSKLTPRILDKEIPGRGKPDFLITFDRVDFAIEVKRPRRRAAAIRNVMDAGAQLRRFDRPGIIVIDATDCMSIDPWQVTRSSSPVRSRVRDELESLHRELEGSIKNYSHSNKFRQVVMLIVYARFWPWVVDDAGPRRDAGLQMRANGFPYIWSNQMNGLTEQIQRRLLLGIEKLTGNPPQFSFL